MPEPHPTAFPGLWQIIAVVALVVANAFFVAAEFALVSVRRTRIDQLAAEGSNSAKLLQHALRDLNRQIGAAQVGITVVSLLLGSTGEKVLEPLFLRLLELGHMPAAFVGLTRVGVALTLAYLIMTAMHVILGEQLPKIIAIQKAETTGLLIVRPMLLFTRLCAPLVWILTHTVDFLLARLGIHSSSEHGQVHSPEELDTLFTQSHEGGEISATEREILHRVVKFSDLTAREVMVPRVEMQGIPLQMKLSELTALLRSQPHTRIPVYNNSMDDIIGIAHLKDLVRFEAESSTQLADGTLPDSELGVNLRPLLREAERVPETNTIDRILIEFKRRRQQMAIVIDEHGGTSGLITMGDLLQQVFGDVHDEFDAPRAAIEELPDGSVRMPGRILIDEINERFRTGFAEDDADTMAGMVLGILGRPAQVGDEVEINDVHLRVEEIERLRITSLSMRLPVQSSTQSGDDDDDS
ncbi:MAG TPA: hemolysin family protein [Abditibacteriaceae bacterium]|nr:hemolysin family protein [Abditibacteriaceae bacterium]